MGSLFKAVARLTCMAAGAPLTMKPGAEEFCIQEGIPCCDVCMGSLFKAVAALRLQRTLPLISSKLGSGVSMYESVFKIAGGGWLSKRSSHEESCKSAHLGLFGGWLS